MYVTSLQLHDFRSYPEVSVDLSPGVTVFVGQNGQGKTNLVEAIEFLATLGSHRVGTDIPLIRHGAERATVRATVRAGIDDDRLLSLEMDIVAGKANRARLNRAPLGRARDILGAVRVVVFSPEDLAIIKGDPSHRRQFLDDLLISRWPRFAGVRTDYERVLRQRSTLLKSLSGRHGTIPDDAASTLDVWDEQLSRLGAEIVVARIATVADLNEHLTDNYRAIAPTNNEANAEYVSAVDVVTDPALSRDEVSALLAETMRQRRTDEIRRGVSLVGPHRDDLLLTIGELPARGYASHGESWSLACALRLAAFHVLRAEAIEPILILDDVFAELDSQRRQRLASSIMTAEQVLITAAVAEDIPTELGGARFTVAAGTVTPYD